MSFSLVALGNIKLKPLSTRQYHLWVKPPLKEVVKGYRKLLTKINPQLKRHLDYVPLKENLILSYKNIITQKSNSPTEKLASLQKFKKNINKLYLFWEQEFAPLTLSHEKELLAPYIKLLKKFKELTIYSLPQISQDQVYQLYTLVYPYLLSQLKIPPMEKQNINSLWGGVIEPIISQLLFKENLPYLARQGHSINLQINEVRMIWTKTHKTSGSLQRSINYIHGQWNRMLKLCLKF